MRTELMNESVAVLPKREVLYLISIKKVWASSHATAVQAVTAFSYNNASAATVVLVG